MSNVVDSKVVELKFDNSKFKTGIKDTQDTLKKFDESLKFKDSAKGLDKIQKSLNNVKFDNLKNGLDTVKVKMSALSVAAATVVQSFTTKALNSLSKLWNSTLGQIKSGGISRALNLEAAQFQLEGLGVAWDKIKDDINYGVKDTAYGLDAAARVASQLVASQVQVGPAMKTALRSISGVAAMTNSTYDDIGRIYTTIAGNGRLMSEQLLQFSSRGLNAAATLAQYLGVSEAEVREMVSKGKIDFATFAAAMDDAFGQHAKDANKTFTGALSNMKAALSRLGAEVATPGLVDLRDVFNSITPVVDKLKDKMKPVLDVINSGLRKLADGAISMFGALGENSLIDSFVSRMMGLINIFKYLASYIKPIKDAFKSVFPQDFVSIISDISHAFGTFTKSLVPAENTLSNLKKIFEGVFSVFDIFRQIFSAVFKELTDRIGNGGPLSDAFNYFMDLAGKIGDSLKKLNDALKSTGTIASIVHTAFEVLGQVFEWVFHIFEPVISVFKTLFGTIPNLIDKVTFAITGNKKEVQNLSDTVKGSMLFEFITRIKDALVGLAQFVWKGLQPVFGGLIDTLKGLTFQDFLSALDKIGVMAGGGLAIGGLKTLYYNFLNISKGYEGLGKLFRLNIFGEFGNKLGTITGQISGAFLQLKKSLKVTVIVEYAAALLMFVKGVATLGNMDTASIIKGMAGLSKSMQMLQRTMQQLTSVINGDPKQLLVLALNILIITSAIKKMVKPIKELGAMKVEDLALGIAAMAAIFGLIEATMAVMSKVGIEKMPLTVKQLVMFSSTLKGVAEAVKVIGEMKVGDVVLGVAAVAILMATIAGFMVYTSKLSWKDVLKIAASLMGFGLGLKVIFNSFKVFKEMDPSSVIMGVAVMETVIGTMIGVIALMKKINGSTSVLTKFAVATGFFSISLKMFSSAINSMGSMDVGTIAKGLATIAVSIGVVLVAMIAFSKVSESMKTGMGQFILFSVALSALSLALIIFGKAIESLGKLKFTEVALGLGSIVVGLGAIAGIARLLDSSSLKNLAVAVGSMYLMASSIEMLAKLGVTSAIGVGALTVSMLAMMGIGKAFKPAYADNLTKASNAILRFSLSLAVISVGAILVSLAIVQIAAAISMLGRMNLAQIGKGLLGFAGAMAIIIGTAVAISKINATLTASAKGFLIFGASLALVGLAALALVGSFALIVQCFKQLQQLGPLTEETKASFESFFDFVLRKISKLLPTLFADLVPMAVQMIDQVFDALATHGPEWIDKGLNFIITLLDKLIEKAPEIVTKIVQLVSAIIQALGTALEAYSGTDLAGLIMGITAVGTVIYLLNSLPFTAGIKGAVIMGTFFVVLGAVMAAIGALLEKFPKLEQFIDKGGKLMVKIGEFVGETIGAIIGAFINKVMSYLPSIATSLSQFAIGIQPFIIGIKMVDDKVLNSAKTICEILLILAGTSIISAIASFFGADYSKLGDELCKFGPKLAKFGKQIEKLNPMGAIAAEQLMKGIAKMVEAMPDFDEDEIDSFCKAFPKLSDGVIKYANRVKNIDVAGVDPALKVAQGINALFKSVENKGGLTSFLAGDSDVEGFVKNVPKLGNGVAKYAKAINGMDDSGTDAALKVAKGINELFKSIENKGGLASFFSGDSDVDGFINNLGPFGKALKNYANSVSGIDDTGTLAAPKVATSVVSVGKYLNKKKNAELFEDSSTYGNFSSNAVILGKAIKSYANNTSGIDATGPGTALTVAKSAKTLAKYINKNSVAELFEDGDIFSNFSRNIVKMGDSIKKYATATAGIDTSGIGIAKIVAQDAKSVAKYLNKESVAELFENGDIYSSFYINVLSMMNTLKLYSGMALSMSVESSANVLTIAKDIKNVFKECSGFKDYTKNIETFKTTTNSFIKAFTNFASKASSIGTAGIPIVKSAIQQLFSVFANLNSNFGSSISGFNQQMSKIGSQGAMSLRASIINGIPSVKSAFTNLISASKNVLNSMPNAVKTIGANSASGFVNGVQSRAGSAGNAARSLANAVRNNIGVNLYGVGQNAAQGFVNGMNSMVHNVSVTGYNLGIYALNAARRAIDSHSPSKAFEKLGVFSDEGFINGFLDKQKEVGNAAFKVGLTAVSETNKAIDSADESSYAPSITPVLDMGNIQNAVNSINSLTNLDTLKLAAKSSLDIDGGNLVNDIKNAVSESFNNLDASIKDLMNKDTKYEFNIPLSINGKEFARATGEEMRNEMDTLNRKYNRLAGIN